MTEGSFYFLVNPESGGVETHEERSGRPAGDREVLGIVTLQPRLIKREKVRVDQGNFKMLLREIKRSNLSDIA